MDDALVAEDIRRIFDLGIFKDIVVEEVTRHDGSLILRYVLKEKPTLYNVKIEGNDSLGVTDIEDVIEKVTGKVGVIDILVNGVGPYAGGPFLELSERDWDFVIDTNLKATFLLTQLVAPMMKQKGWGRIINFSAGSADYRGASVYGLAKNAIRYLTQSLALELGPEITVNDISI